MPSFAVLSPFANAGLLVASALLLWFSASRLALYADVIATRFGLGDVVVGVLLLAGITSLPEIVTSITASIADDAILAVNGLLGSVALQVAILAVADLVYDKRALTSVVPDPIVMLQGGINVILLVTVAAAILYSDRVVLGAGIWTWGLLAASIYGLRKIATAGDRQPWIAEGLEAKKERHVDIDDGNSRLFMKTAAVSLLILLGGFVAARSAGALAEQTGMGSSFMGMVFLALATSLPELSTVFAAMRRGLYTMAISDILGTNIFNIALLFGIDIVASGSPVLTRVGAFSAMGALIGAAITGIFLMGLVERRDRTIWRMGVDSAAVLAVYVGGIVMLYTLR